MGAHSLHFDPGCCHPDISVLLLQVGDQAILPHLSCPIHYWLCTLRPGMEFTCSHFLPHFARNWGSSAVSVVHHLDLPRVPTAGTRCRDGLLWYSRASGPRPRPDAWW